MKNANRLTASSWRCVMGALFVGLLLAPALAQTPEAANDLDKRLVPKDDRTARVLPRREVSLSTNISGQIEHILVDVNDLVKKDQVLVQLDDEIQTLQVESAQLTADSNAEIEARQAMLKDAQNEYDKQDQLMKQQAGSARDKDRAEAQRDLAKANLTAAKDQKALAQVALKQQQALLRRYQIKAPFDGRVMEVESEIGATVDERVPIVKILEMDPLIIEADLPIFFRNELKVDETYHFTSKSRSAKVSGYQAKLLTIAPANDYGSKTCRFRFSLANPNGEIAPGVAVYFDWPQPSDNRAAKADDAVSE